MIYFIQNTRNYHIKIGFTDKPIRLLLSSLQTGNSARLVLLGIMQGDEATEEYLHQRFSDGHIRGDWFQPIPSLLQYIIQTSFQGELKLEEKDKWPLFIGNHECGYYLRCPECGGELFPANPTVAVKPKYRFLCKRGHRWYIPIWKDNAEGRFSVRATPSVSGWEEKRKPTAR